MPKIANPKSLIAYGLVVLGLAFAVQSSQHRDQATRTAICTILQQADAATYAQAEAGKLPPDQLKTSLSITAAFRQELGPAPHCNPYTTRPGEAPPLRPRPAP